MLFRSVRKDHLCEHPAEPQGGAAVRLQPGQLLPRHLSSARLLLRAAKTGSLHWSPFGFTLLKRAVIYYFLVRSPDDVTNAWSLCMLLDTTFLFQPKSLVSFLHL